jgi:hypothetical protein
MTVANRIPLTIIPVNHEFDVIAPTSYFRPNNLLENRTETS